MEYSSMEDEKKYMQLNCFMVKNEHKDKKFDYFISKLKECTKYNLAAEYEINGFLYVKKQEEKKPTWQPFVEKITNNPILELSTKSSSAVLLIKTEKSIYAFTFGYGRFLIDLNHFSQDFGIKTALNSLNHDTLRSVDLYTIDDQAVQTKSQASRETDVSAFGIDIFKDVLRAVTGSPKRGVELKNISGGDSVFSFAVEMIPNEIPNIADKIYDLYQKDDYKENFTWVDNIRRIKDKIEIAGLDLKLIELIKQKNDGISITIPEVIDWDKISGFSFTRSKSPTSPLLDIKSYLENFPEDLSSIEQLKRDKLFVYDTYGNEIEYQVYKSIYLSIDVGDKNKILFNGFWYEINKSFIDRIDASISSIPISTLKFPDVHTWVEKKDGKDKDCIEAEGDYNIRAAKLHNYILLDKKLIKSNRNSSPIELCDLLTTNKQLIHVKHKKGGSAGLSHLFAQGNVSAETILGDKDARKDARRVIKNVAPEHKELITLDKIKTSDYEIVFLIIGDNTADIRKSLPFFSKVNLSKTFENLSQKGFRVSIAATPTCKKPAI